MPIRALQRQCACGGRRPPGTECDACRKERSTLQRKSGGADDAITKRNALRAQIIEVERLYTLYRNIPYEADAHEVGDAAEQALRGWP